MTSFRSCVAYLAVVAGVLAASPASAQSGRATASINFGAQGSSGDFTQRLTPTIYDEAAAIDIAQNYESGPLFDIGGGFLLFGNIGVGVSYSRTAGDGVASVAAQIPDPLFYDRPRGASASVDALKHTENAVHLQVFYRFAASPKLDISVGVGPTFFSVKQDLVDSVTVAEPTPTITPVVATLSDSPVGVNLGADVTYMVTKSIGAGVLLRYATGSADFATASGTSISLDAGGFQFAVGLRVRF
ncbi:MAG: outer membrane beta-barrel protein [Vicinamibacteria bacterium]|nr:outer membrane beta-barrel protein [Vicinamibacteria bacterium]